MKYGKDYDLSLLTDQQHDIVELLIRRELTAPSGPFRSLVDLNPDGDEVASIARQILRRPDRAQQVAMRADCIHASFGIVEYIKNGRLSHG